MKKIILSSLAIFAAWTAVDFLLHGVLLRGLYESTAYLWRPMPELKRGLMSAVTFLVALGFSVIWGRFVGVKTVANGLRFGLWWGFVAGVSMGYGSYAMMPIPHVLALSWFLGSVVEGVLAGVIAAQIDRGQ